jgi:hypothetical protein
MKVRLLLTLAGLAISLTDIADQRVGIDQIRHGIGLDE